MLNILTWDLRSKGNRKGPVEEANEVSQNIFYDKMAHVKHVKDQLGMIERGTSVNEVHAC